MPGMIPRVCGNCQCCLIVADGEQVAFGECIAHAQRVYIQDPGNYMCVKDFIMSEQPNYVIPEQNIEMDAGEFIEAIGGNSDQAGNTSNSD